MTNKIYNLIFNFFKNRFGSDEYTSKSAGLSLTTGLILIIILVSLYLFLILLFNYNYLKQLNLWYFVIIIFGLYAIVIKFVKTRLKKK